MCTFCFSPFAADFFCFFAFTAGFLFCLAFCGTDHYRRSRTVPVYFQELIRAVTTALTVISSASARMCFTFTWFCSPLYDLSIHLIKTSFFFRGTFYATKQLPLEKNSHVRILYLALTRACHACVHMCACERGGRYF